MKKQFNELDLKDEYIQAFNYSASNYIKKHLDSCEKEATDYAIRMVRKQEIYMIIIKY